MGKRFGKLIWYDLNYGYQDCRLRWICALLVQVYLANMAYQACSRADGAAGAAGYLTWLFRGMPEYFVSETGRFELPVSWLLLHAALLFLVGFYPASDLMRSGSQAFVRAGRRRGWMLGKAAWVACTVVLYYVCLTVVLVMCAMLTGGVRGPAGTVAALCGISYEGMGSMDIFLVLWVEPLLVSLALCMAEMVLSLLMEPALAFFLMLGYLTASVFWKTPVLLGNYSMLLRQDLWFGDRGISFSNCVIGCVGCSVGALCAGSKYIRRKDIFRSEI